MGREKVRSRIKAGRWSWTRSGPKGRCAWPRDAEELLSVSDLNKTRLLSLLIRDWCKLGCTAASGWLQTGQSHWLPRSRLQWSLEFIQKFQLPYLHRREICYEKNYNTNNLCSYDCCSFVHTMQGARSAPAFLAHPAWAVFHTVWHEEGKNWDIYTHYVLWYHYKHIGLQSWTFPTSPDTCKVGLSCPSSTLQFGTPWDNDVEGRSCAYWNLESFQDREHLKKNEVDKEGNELAGNTRRIGSL